MIEEALKYLTDQAVAAAEPKVFDVPGETAGYVWIWDGKSLSCRNLAPPMRNHALESLASVVEFVKMVESDDVKTVVWVSEEEITVVCDDGDRRDQATMNLNFSPQFRFLSDRQWFNQKDFVDALRTKLIDCGADIRNLLQIVQKLRFLKNDSDAVRMLHGEESVDRSIQVRLAGETEKLPETVRMTVPVYVNPGMDQMVDVPCSVLIDVDNKVFSLVPQGNHLTSAVITVLANATDFLRKKLSDVVVLEGSP